MLFDYGFNAKILEHKFGIYFGNFILKFFSGNAFST